MRTGMRVSEAVNRDLGIAHAVEIRDERGEPIDAKVCAASPARPVHSISDARNSSQPFSSRDEVLQAPIGRDEQGDTQFGMSIEKMLEATERAVRQVAPGFVFVAGSCRMDIIHAETHRAATTFRQPIAAGAQPRHGRECVECPGMFSARHACAGTG